MIDFEKIASTERARRVRSLSNSRALYMNAADALEETAAQSLIVMCYAHWEGYFNFGGVSKSCWRGGLKRAAA